MKILHLAPYEKKFFAFAADIFDTQDVDNQYIILTKDVRRAREFFANRKNFRIEHTRYIRSDSFSCDLKECDCLVVHFLHIIKAQAIMRTPKHLPVVWAGWGGDYYDLLSQSGFKLLGDRTQQLVYTLERQIGCSTTKIIRRFKALISKIRYSVFYAPIIKKAIKRVDFFSSPFEEDFALLRSHFEKDFDPIYTRIFYGSVERTFMSGVESIYGNNILIGNSATATNNHLEVFEMLSTHDLGDRQIIVPLSYGDTNYRDAIIAYGSSLFGDRFQPVVDLMPLDEYNTHIAQCSMVVMGHRRQEGAGNTFTMLYKGSKVFLDEANTVYQYLKNNGAYVYALQDLRSGEESIFDALTDEQKHKNRQVMEEYTGNEVVLRGMRDFIRQIKEYGVRKHA